MADFVEISDPSEFTVVEEQSAAMPVLLFKHSNSCSISSDLFREVSALDSRVYLVVVQRSRALSDEISSRLQLRHESPQAIVLKNSGVVYHASHYDIDIPKIRELLEK